MTLLSLVAAVKQFVVTRLVNGGCIFLSICKCHWFNLSITLSMQIRQYMESIKICNLL